MRRRHAGRLAMVAAAAVTCALSLVVSGGAARAATRNTSACGPGATASVGVAASSASITLSRTKGPPGMSLEVSGTGWPEGATVLVDVDAKGSDGTLYVLIATVVSTNVASGGTFQMQAFPAPQPGGCGDISADTNNVLFVAHTRDNSLSAEAPFTYTAQPTLDSPSGQQVRPNFAVTLTSENWEPGEQVTITSGVVATAQVSCIQQGPPACSQVTTPAPSATVHATANAQGAISLTYALPRGLPPRSGVLVQATGTGPLYGTVAAPPLGFLIVPSVDPAIALNRTTGTAGVAVVVQGSHWYPGDTVVIEYCRAENVTNVPELGARGGQSNLRCDPQVAQWLGQVTVDANGRFTSTVSVPTNARIGPITIQARVPNDIFGLAVYAQVAAFEIVPPPLPWSHQHPRMALALTIGRPAVPALVLGTLLLAGYVWSRRRARRMASVRAG